MARSIPSIVNSLQRDKCVVWGIVADSRNREGDHRRVGSRRGQCRSIRWNPGSLGMARARCGKSVRIRFGAYSGFSTAERFTDRPLTPLSPARRGRSVGHVRKMLRETARDQKVMAPASDSGWLCRVSGLRRTSIAMGLREVACSRMLLS